MPKVRITTGWVGDGKTPETAYRPAVVATHALKDWVDVHGKDPRQGGTYTVEANVTALQLTALQGDATYLGKLTVLIP